MTVHLNRRSRGMWYRAASLQLQLAREKPWVARWTYPPSSVRAKWLSHGLHIEGRDG